MPDGALTLSSTYNVVGYNKDDNVLEIKFNPAAPIAPTNEGLVHLKMPYWYYINFGAKSLYMYNDNAENECTSD